MRVPALAPAVVAALVLVGLPVVVAPAPARAGETETCRLRLANLSADLPTLRFELSPHPAGSGEGAIAAELARNEARGYLELPPARYRARLISGGERVGSIVFGCDPHGRYTLAAFGSDPRNADRGPSWLDRLRGLFGGVEARTARGDLLQPSLFQDAVGRSGESAFLRAVHAAPGIAPLSVRAWVDGEASAVAQGLRYAARGEPVDLPPGRHRIEVRHAGAREPMAEAWLDAEPGRVYTLFLVPGAEAEPGAPVEVLVLSNPVRAERRALR